MPTVVWISRLPDMFYGIIAGGYVERTLLHSADLVLFPDDFRTGHGEHSKPLGVGRGGERGKCTEPSERRV